MKTRKIETLRATRDEMQRGLSYLELQSVQAQQELWEFRELMDQLNVAWDVEPKWTVGQCITYLNGNRRPAEVNREGQG